MLLSDKVQHSLDQRFFQQQQTAQLTPRNSQKMHIKEVWFLDILDIGLHSPQLEFWSQISDFLLILWCEMDHRFPLKIPTEMPKPLADTVMGSLNLRWVGDSRGHASPLPKTQLIQNIQPILS